MKARALLIVGLCLSLLSLPGCRTPEPSGSRTAWTLNEGGVIRGDVAKKKLALIFTGGEHGGGSEHILDTLAEHNVKASFFPTGDYIAMPGYDAYLTRMVNEDHYLGPHGHAHLLYAPWDNRAESLVTESQFKDDLQTNINQLRKYGAMPKGQAIYFIPPFQWYNAQHAQWAGEMGCVLFNFTPGSGSHRDWAPEGYKAFKPSRAILSDILECEATDPHGLNGHLLLMHLGSLREDKMHLLLGELIDELHARGYELVRVDELLATD